MRTSSLVSRTALAAALLALAVTGLAVVPAASAAAGEGCEEPVVAGGVARVVCPYTGAAALWKVPAGVTSVTFDLYGAQGGSQANTRASVPGGPGAHLHSVQVLTPGQVLMVVVGGSPAPDSVAGGFNGGGSATGRTGPVSQAGGGGGGATDVRTGPDYALADRFLVAAGGGGNGGNGVVPGTRGLQWVQGASGGTSGEQGCCGLNGGGRAYTGLAGAGGAGGADIDYEPPQTYAPSGSPGQLGVGGHAPHGYVGAYSGSGGGGGGGGGYYGGGGGGAAGRCLAPGEQCAGYAAGGYGGGGGADYIGGYSSPHDWVLDGAWQGNGLAVITYRAP